MKIIAIIQARQNSKRFPNKVLEKIDDKTILEHCIESTKAIEELDEIVVLTGKREDNQRIFKLCHKRKDIILWEGDEDNLLLGYVNVGTARRADYILRVCADNPFFNPLVSSYLIKKATEVDSIDYTAFKYFKDSKPTVALYPLGNYKEVIKTKALLNVWKKLEEVPKEHKSRYIEHVTPYFYEAKDRSIRINLIELCELNRNYMCIDYPKDLETARKRYATFPA